MSQTVIGFFDDQTDAQRAVAQLQSRGISRDRIDFSRGGTAAGSTSSNSTAGRPDINPVSGSERDENSVRRTSDDRTVDRGGRNTNVFTDFFNNLFGGRGDNKEDDDANRYSHVASRAGAIVTIHAQSREEAERAAEILDDCGAVDVDEKASQYGYANTRSTGDLSGRSNASGDLTSGNRTGSGSARMRSRIFDRVVDDNRRLRSTDLDDRSGLGTTNRDSTSI